MRKAIWQVSRYGFAAGITFLAVASLPVLASLALGGISFGLGLFMAVASPFFLDPPSDPPIGGVIVGIFLAIASIVFTILIVIILLVLALALCLLILTPLGILIGFITKNRKSIGLTMLLFFVAGLFVGGLFGVGANFLAASQGWEIARTGWGMLGLFVLGMGLGLASASIYGAVLVFFDAIYGALKKIAAQWFAMRRQNSAKQLARLSQAKN